MLRPTARYSLLLLKSILLLLSVNAFGASSVEVGALLTPRSLHTSTPLPDGRILIAGGFNNGTPLRSAEVFDPALGTFSETGSMTVERYNHTATALGDGRILIVGGTSFGAPSLSSAEVYDFHTGTFQRIADMAVARRGHTATLMRDGHVLIAGGAANAHIHASMELFDPATNTFKDSGQMPEPRVGHTATALSSGRIVIVGGLTPGLNDALPLSSAIVYDPALRGFSTLPPLRAALAFHSAFLLQDDRVAIVASGPSWSVMLIDGNHATVEAVVVLGLPHAFAAALTSDGRILVVGGFGDGYAASFMLFRTNGTEASTSPLARARAGSTVTPIDSRRVLVVGGSTNRGATRSAEIITY